MNMTDTSAISPNLLMCCRSHRGSCLCSTRNLLGCHFKPPQEGSTCISDETATLNVVMIYCLSFKGRRTT